MPPKKRSNPKSASKRHDAKGDRKYQPRATIQGLPVEVLTIIFRIIEKSSIVVVENTPACRAYPGSVYRLPENRRSLGLTGPTVGAGWNSPVVADGEVMEGHLQTLPEFWTRFVIFLDKRAPTAISQIQAQVKKCTPAHPLDVLVTRRTFPDESNDAEMKRESSRARSVMKILAPLIPRCQSFVFDVLHSSSLPYISQDFRGEAPYLRVLKLEYQIEDENSRLPDHPDIDPDEEFIFPLLTTLALDGNRFIDACCLPSWEAQVKGLSLDTLSVSNFTAPDPDEVSLDIDVLIEYISRIAYIRHLTLAYVGVYGEPGIRDAESLELPIDNLTIINQDRKCMEEFFSVTFGTSLCYVHLFDTEIDYYSIPVLHHLRLERTPDLGRQFWLALERFFGHRLDIIDCEEFSNIFYISPNIASQCADSTLKIAERLR